jgi:hypothetical protein
MYEKVQLNSGITAYGRCIGHGGMPVELTSSSFNRCEGQLGASKLVMVDDRMQPGTHAHPLGYNGYVVLSLKEERLEIGYFDVQGKLFSESWLADIRTGNITGSIDPPGTAGLKTEGGRPWSDAVK